MRLLPVILVFLFSILISFKVKSQDFDCRETYSVSGSDRFFVPANVSQIRISVVGGGGSGGVYYYDRAGGGGAGGYSQSVISVSAGDQFFINVGSGGVNSDGGDSWVSRDNIKNNAIVLAKGGGKANGQVGGVGGNSENGRGDSKVSGGDGESAQNNRSGSGGDSAYGNGGVGIQGQHGSGNAGTQGGGGGGATVNRGNSHHNPGVGGAGFIEIEYKCQFTDLPSCAFLEDTGVRTGEVVISYREGICEWSPPAGLMEFEVFLVGGGGGGGRGEKAGGGGAGGVVRRKFCDVNNGNGFNGNEKFIVEVGNGGNGSLQLDSQGGDGNKTYFRLETFFEIIVGGGGGGGSDLNSNGRKGNGYASSGGGAAAGGDFGDADECYLIAGDSCGIEDSWCGFPGGGADGQNDGAGGAGGGGGGNSTSGVAGSYYSLNANGGNGGSGYFYSINNDRSILVAAGGGGTASVDIEFSRAQGEGGDNVGGIARNPGSGGVGLTVGSGGGAGITAGGAGQRGLVIVRFELISINPVEWYEVSAKYEASSRSNSVNWSTLKEWENSHFEIERSIDGVKDYKKIGRVEGMGWSDDLTEYSFCDEDLPLRGGRVYYRIKQVDFDGTFDYSQTMMVNVPGVQVTKGDWRAYPNPIRGYEFNIARLAAESLRSDIQVKVMTSQIPLATFTAKSEVELNRHLQKLLPRIPKGVFVVELQSNQQVEYLKVIKD
ncbi:hypothetical protein KI659_09110 [Litoribacter alkaliphilus]|uniref:Glycine-rich domain-containing protein n=1 Tax=Litoribacter ruber TaxID=702568 RepID=A0AAP2CHZ0_9BACT|nr:hypothetical protein [Litoribacter alkaliphilus]MBS9524170.1 hypothetical protein [Litoribacter alkaliphilus]